MKGSIGTSLKGRMIIADPLNQKEPKREVKVKAISLLARLDSIAKNKQQRLENKKINRRKRG